MTQEQIKIYIGHIVQITMRDGTIHIGELKAVEAYESHQGYVPEHLRIGDFRFMPDLVENAFIYIGGNN